MENHIRNEDNKKEEYISMTDIIKEQYKKYEEFMILKELNDSVVLQETVSGKKETTSEKGERN